MIVLNDNSETRKQAARVVAVGGVIGFRTDTFYGLGADPLNVSAVQSIRALKVREESKPILLLISDLSEIDRFVTFRSKLFDSVADQYWPGPLTLVGTARPELSDELTAGSDTIGIRLPDDQQVRDLVRLCGGALTATSANLSGQEPALSAQDVVNYFPERLDLVIDGGEVTVTKPSTVLDLSGSMPHLIREGAITRQELKGFLGDVL